MNALEPVSSPPKGEQLDLGPLREAVIDIPVSGGRNEHVALSSGGPGMVPLTRVFRFKWTITLVALAVIAPATAGVWMWVKPEYRSSAVVRVAPVIPRLVFKTDDNGQIPLYENFLNTQMSIIRSPAVLQRVLESPEVQKTRWYRREEQSWFGTPLTHMERLQNALSVTTRRRTELIDVGVSSEIARDAEVLANAVADHYLKVTNESMSQLDDELYRQLSEAVSSWRERIKGAEDNVARARRALGTANPEQLLSQRAERLDTKMAKLDELRRDLQLAEWQLSERERQSAERASKPEDARPEPAPSRGAYETDGQWQQLHTDLRNLRQELALVSGQKGENHPDMVRLRTAVGLAETALQDREAELAMRTPTLAADGTVSAGPEDIHERLKRLKYESELLSQEVAKERDEVARTLDMVDQMTSENQSIRHDRDMYEAAVTRQRQKEIERNVPASISIAARAMTPSQPSGDRRFLLTGMIAVMGCTLGLGTAYLRATVSPWVQDIGDMSRPGAAPFLGQLPFMSERDRSDPLRMAVEKECTRMVRTALFERMKGHGGHTVMVTSAGSQAGKTTLSVGLAHSLAECGKTVLLVDADLRNPSAASRMQLDSGPGLVGVLAGRSGDAEAIRTTAIPGLSVLPAGHLTHMGEAELLANGALASWLRKWRSRYDVVLVDSPPVLPVADARILSRLVEGTIMVVRARSCKQRDVVHALAELSAAGGKLVGTVLIGSYMHKSYYTQYRGSGDLLALQAPVKTS